MGADLEMQKLNSRSVPTLLAFPLIAVFVAVSGCGSSGASTDDISKIASVNSECANYDSLGSTGQELCRTITSRVRDACNGKALDRGAFINNNGSDGGVSQAEAELSALCPEKADTTN